MSLPVTLIVLGLSIALFVWARWHSQRERPLGEVSLVPHTILQLAALILTVALLAHLFTLLTGVTLPARSGPGRW